MTVDWLIIALPWQYFLTHAYNPPAVEAGKF